MQAHSTGEDARTLSMDSIQIYADGKMTSEYAAGEDPVEPTISVKLNDTLRLHAGGKIIVISIH